MSRTLGRGTGEYDGLDPQAYAATHGPAPLTGSASATRVW